MFWSSSRDLVSSTIGHEKMVLLYLPVPRILLWILQETFRWWFHKLYMVEIMLAQDHQGQHVKARGYLCWNRNQCDHQCATRRTPVSIHDQGYHQQNKHQLWKESLHWSKWRGKTVEHTTLLWSPCTFLHLWGGWHTYLGYPATHYRQTGSRSSQQG